MINIVIPMAGPAMFFDQSDFQYPKPLIEPSSCKKNSEEMRFSQ